MTALGAMLSDRDRDRLAKRLTELRQTARLIAERGQQRPAPEPVPLHQTTRPEET